MELRYVLVELLPYPAVFVERRPIDRAVPRLEALQARHQIVDDSLAAGLVAVQIQAETGEPHPLEALVDHLECGTLLADEQHTLALAQGLGDDVDDRLTLARPRRPLDDQRPALPDVLHHLELARIRIQGGE